MNVYSGNLIKMRTEYEPGENDDPQVVKYFLALEEEEIFLNERLGDQMEIEYQHQINCIKCGRVTSKSFAQGFCYPCFVSVPETEDCVLRPEMCRAHEGIARDMDYARSHCLIDQVVYLALSSGLKVGVTRSTQIPVRWIDQGAVRAIKLAVTPNRHIAGSLEVALKEHFRDKTNWRNMLQNIIDGGIDLVWEKGKAEEMLPNEMREYVSEDDGITSIVYPVEKYPEKVKSINLEKTDKFMGRLTGIKGQYLMFENGDVINIRKHNGFMVALKF